MFKTVLTISKKFRGSIIQSFFGKKFEIKIKITKKSLVYVHHNKKKTPKSFATIEDFVPVHSPEKSQEKWKSGLNCLKSTEKGLKRSIWDFSSFFK
jgi:hypothetical protein